MHKREHRRKQTELLAVLIVKWGEDRAGDIYFLFYTVSFWSFKTGFYMVNQKSSHKVNKIGNSEKEREKGKGSGRAKRGRGGRRKDRGNGEERKAERDRGGIRIEL